MSEYNQQNPQFPEHINRSEENPLKEFAILVVGLMLVVVISVATLSFAAKTLAPFIPFSWENKAINSWQDNSTQHNDDNEFHAQKAALQALANQLSSKADLPEGMTISLHYFDDETINAFATLGGHIFVFRGLLEQMDSENALAMVLAHEIAHIKHRHPIQALSRGIIMQVVMAAIFGSSQDLQVLMGQTGLLTMLSFNRDMEREADQEALNILQQYYGHTKGAEVFFAKMLKRQEQPKWSTFLNSHPHLSERLDTIKQSQQNGSLTAMPKALIIESTEKQN